MEWLRTIRGLVPLLVGLFVVAQFAGVAPIRAAHVYPMTGDASAAVHDEPHQGETVHEHADGSPCAGHEHDGANLPGAPGGDCCALHGLTAIVPDLIVAVPIGTIGQRIADRWTDKVTGIHASRLDRPPKSLLSL